MKIYDCFMYFDEEMLLDFRLNYLNEYVDKFVIVESGYTHSGNIKKLLFDIKKFEKFRNKIHYIVAKKEPSGIMEVHKEDSENKKNTKYILNAVKRENHQRNYISEGLINADPDDYVMISDIDEIPNLERNNLKDIKKKLIFFKQKVSYYKFNLQLESFEWFGTKACKKSNLISPQWLRNVKDKQYSFWRFDTFFSNKKYQNIHFINDGGWHFSYMKNAQDIEKKLRSYLHHREYDNEPLGVTRIEQMMRDKIAIYDLKVDMRKSKFNKGQELKIVDIKLLPSYLQNNIEKYKEWIDI